MSCVISWLRKRGSKVEKCNIDTEYGNYKDFDSYYWADDFFPTKSVRENARNKFNEVVTDILDD